MPCSGARKVHSVGCLAMHEALLGSRWIWPRPLLTDHPMFTNRSVRIHGKSHSFVDPPDKSHVRLFDTERIGPIWNGWPGGGMWNCLSYLSQTEIRCLSFLGWQDGRGVSAGSVDWVSPEIVISGSARWWGNVQCVWFRSGYRNRIIGRWPFVNLLFMLLF
jgi:hypothetical protein